MKVKYRLKRLSVEEKVQIVTSYNGGMPIADIMKKFEISKATLYRTLSTAVDSVQGEQDVIV